MLNNNNNNNNIQPQGFQNKTELSYPKIIFTYNLPQKFSGFDDGDYYFDNDDEEDTPKSEYNFTHIGGYHSVKEELIQMKELLMNKDLYKEYNVRTPKGLLLEGPPGNGKTLLAKCFAGECNFSFLSCSGSEFNEKYVGVGAQRVRELFQKAKRKQPCVLFIDELDALGGKRSHSDEGASNERFQTLNQLLVLMDGFDSDTMNQIFIMAATNRKDILDDALLRSGRFDKIIHVPQPDSETRRAIINIHKKNKPIDSNLNMEGLVEITKGFSGADIENILNEASLEVLRKGTIIKSMDIFEQVRDKILVGTSNQKRTLSQEIKERVAIHECGHLLIGLMCPLHEQPTKVTIDTSGKGTLGYTFFSLMEEKSGLYSKQYLKEKIMTLLGGRIAEEIFYSGEVSTGAIDDLNRVMDIAKRMVTEHGMVKKPIFSFMSEKNKNMIDEQINEIIDEAYKEVYEKVERNKKVFLQFQKELLFHGTLNKSQITLTLKRALQRFPSKDFSTKRF
jgi:cell division protease FtsH